MQLVFEEGSGEPTAGERVEDENSEIQDARSHLCCMIGILYLSNCSTLVKESIIVVGGHRCSMVMVDVHVRYDIDR